MPSLIDLFNPTFLIFLGILVLVVALMVVYFESKMREQNHKISSMLSLVSSLAEELNGVKFGLTHLSMRGGAPETFSQTNHLEENKISIRENKLIAVSDDESDDDLESVSDAGSVSESETDSDSDSEIDSASNLDSDVDILDDASIECDDLNIDDSNEVKVLKLNIVANIIENDNVASLAEEDFNVVEDYTDQLSVSESVISKGSQISLKQNAAEENKHDSGIISQTCIISQTDFKTISINLEEPSDSLDYRKLSLTKLKSIVTEKGLIVDSSRLKKPELLKLLGIE